MIRLLIQKIRIIILLRLKTVDIIVLLDMPIMREMMSVVIVQVSDEHGLLVLQPVVGELSQGLFVVVEQRREIVRLMILLIEELGLLVLLPVVEELRQELMHVGQHNLNRVIRGHVVIMLRLVYIWLLIIILLPDVMELLLVIL